MTTTNLNNFTNVYYDEHDFNMMFEHYIGFLLHGDVVRATYTSVTFTDGANEVTFLISETFQQRFDCSYDNYYWNQDNRIALYLEILPEEILI